MVQGIGHGGAAMAAAESSQVVNTPLTTGGAGDSGGLLSQQVDAKEASTAPKFGDIYKQIQAKYGEKPEKPREIKKTLGKDDFLRIMITQMKNQDPTNPFKAEQMATEIAQFTSVEQLQNVNQNLAKISTQSKPLEQMAMTNLIGKTVTMDRERFPHIEGQVDSLSFNLPKDATSVRVALISDTGENVLEKDLGSQKAGEGTFNWDGMKSNTLPAKTGTYMLRVEAKDDQGKSIETNPMAQARIVGVSFEGTEPVFLVGDARHQDKITMRNIVRIDQDSGQLPASKGITSVAVPQSKPPNFIEFQKGVGSSTLSPNSIKPEVAKVLEKFQQAGSPPTGPSTEEKGFPSGLGDPEQQKFDPKQSEQNKGGGKS